MSKTTIESVETRISSDSVKNDTLEVNSRQGVISQRPLRRALGKTALALSALGLAGLSLAGLQPSVSQAEASGMTSDLTPPASIPARILQLASNLSPSLRYVMSQGDIFTRVTPSGLEIREELISPGGPGAIKINILPVGYNNDMEAAANDAKLMANGFKSLDVIKDHPGAFEFMMRVDGNIGSLNCNRQSLCDLQAFKAEIRKAKSAGIYADHTNVMKKEGVTSQGELVTDFNHKSSDELYSAESLPTSMSNDPRFINGQYKTGFARELMKNLGKDDPKPGPDGTCQTNPDCTGSYMGTGNTWLPSEADQWKAIITSNQDNPKARYIHPDPQIFAIRDATKVAKLAGLSVLPAQAQGLKELDTGILAIFPNGIEQVYIKREPGLSKLTGQPEGAVLEHYLSGSDVVHSIEEIGLKDPEPVRGITSPWTLGGQSYTYKVKMSPLKEPLIDQDGKPNWDDPRWNEFEIWPGKKTKIPVQTVTEFTPPPTSGSISDKYPADRATVDTLTPLLQWDDAKTNQAYYEVRITESSNRYPDGEFIVDPTKAVAAVTWEIIEGGITKPENSYNIKPDYALGPGKEYSWQVRPRVQADGKPVAWSKTWTFRTSADATVKQDARTAAPK